jgi:cysteine desulfurase/selenocysteine lyase
MFRTHFPIFQTHPDLVYLDSASTAQKPKEVLEAMREMIEGKYANIHRGSYSLSEMSEVIFEDSKEILKSMIGALSRHEILYTYNATYAANLLTRSLVKSGMLVRGDRVLLSLLEHHANIVPWQIIAEEYGIIIDWVGVTPDGRIDYDDLEKKLP